MPRRRELPTACRAVLAELAGQLRDRMRDAGISQGQAAIRLHCHPSRVSRALSGREMPQRDLLLGLARMTDVDAVAVMERWASADAARRQARDHTHDGGPPDGLANYPALLRALRELLRDRRVSQRELARRVPGLRRSTIGAALRGERSIGLGMVITIVRACGVTGDAERAWSAAWWRLGQPYPQEQRRRRWDGYRYAIDQGMPWL